MNSEYDSYDVRQYKRMLNLISSYESVEISFDRLVNDIEALVLSLEDTTQDEQNELLSIWGGLEEILANSLDRGDRTFVDVNKIEINRVLSHLKEKIMSRIAHAEK
ncbi:MAG: hypothetical protein KZQ97_22180 [Candidatus Thiodiazotropha sp. (ex Dulcina madagascariensis)]|nr:hypothetical protein [Candidatus Thiodiazotropha sp. (ex Dulcina madagascariensis)]